LLDSGRGEALGRQYLTDEGFVSDRNDLPSRQSVFLPSAEILAVVAVEEVPPTPPACLSGLVVALRDNGRNLDWKLSAQALLQAGVVREFWSWRRRWTASWSVGPTSNVLALVDTARRSGHAPGHHLQSVLDRMCTADYEDVAFDPADFADLIPQLDELHEVLTATTVDAVGLAMIDDTPGRQAPARTLRRWVTNTHESVLAANADAEVIVRHKDGLVVVHGDDMKSEFGGISHVDLTGDEIVVANDAGQRIRLAPSQARPLAWLAPNSLRWNVREIPIVDVWAPLFEGLPRAVDAALWSGNFVNLTSAFAVG
jgi:hypothetical protein